MAEIQVVHDALAHYLSKPGISKDVATNLFTTVTLSASTANLVFQQESLIIELN